MPEDKEQFALAMNGKRRISAGRIFWYLQRNAAWHGALPKKMIAMLMAKKRFLAMCQNSLLPGLWERLASLIEERAGSWRAKLQF